MTKPVVVDIGMYDGTDTAYYLATGHRVIAVEANPALVARVRQEQSNAIREGHLTILHGAIAPSRDPVTLTLSGVALCAASTIPGVVDPRIAAGSYTVDGLTMADVLCHADTRPRFIKIDIEGADHLCLPVLTKETRPDFLSIEVHEGPDPVLPELLRLGYTRFKLIDQRCFREISRRRMFRDRLRHRVMRQLGLGGPQWLFRSGRWFQVQSSGPAPWESDGPWHSAAEVSRQFSTSKDSLLDTWCDLHAH